MKPLLSLALVLALAACSSTPAPRFHSLLATQAPAVEAVSTVPLPIDIAPVSVPPAVDQQQWVVRLPDDSLRILEQEQWVAPLRDELRAALFDRLAKRYGAVDVRSSPTAEYVRLKVDVQRFESMAAREVWIEAVWTATPTAKGNPPLVCRSGVREPVNGDAQAIAAAHRRAVHALADLIGQRLLALYNGAGVRCP
ncbi:membrane integrity-associated transporter subunit PqiC [Piscinibacter sp. HJYY11]|uniref:PqiC family protein n=1 Tax=Piscinibacter sp. HJYY11 TaxID=2801333 RepID=UPI00191F2D71|nr:PqiC family protein [Piscinibacter sp. HJYY11]MBL0730464.1 membrane integrity-associated transporter subunit PqiC [Piscinibacter sp. HJYY11]